MKKRLVKSIATLALAAAVLVPGTVSRAEESMPFDTELTETVELAEGTQLPVPTGLSWDGWNITWDAVEDAHGYYGIEVYKDGERFLTTNLINYSNSEFDFYVRMTDSGVYKFRVKTNADYYAGSMSDSEWSDFSDEKTYVRPDEELGTTVGWWDTETAGLFHWTPVEGAGGYALRLYVDDGIRPRTTIYTLASAQYNFSNKFATYDGEHTYTVTVQAISGDLDTVANGSEGEKSPAYDTKAAGSDANNVIDNEVSESSTTEEAVRNIVDSMGMSNLSLAMQTDSSVMERIAQLDETMKAEKGITVAEPVLDEAAASLVDSGRISMVGAALSADTGNVGLEVSVPEEQVDVKSNNYINSVQLDIRLVNNGVQVNTLNAPITITMPIPEGLTTDRLTILHYSADGSYQTENFKDNGDGTVTFTVTHFSTFVFANESDQTAGNTPDGDGPENETGTDSTEEDDDDDDANVTTAQASAAQSSQAVLDDVPKTGDEGIPAAMPVAVATAMVCAALAFALGRNRQKNK